MKSPVRVIHSIASAAALEPATRTKTTTEKTKRDCRALGDTSYSYLHLLSLLFLATVLQGSSLSVDFTAATTYYPT